MLCRSSSKLGALRFLPTRRGLLLVGYLLTLLPYILIEDERPEFFRPRELRLDRWLNDAEFWGDITVSASGNRGA